MAQRSGTASLPLHHGRVPRWLANRMATLGAAITEAVVLNEGRSGFLTRLSDPFWFQAFGAVLGMDWHSSGITTSVLSALKRGLKPRAGELGIHVCGGRGKQSRRTPQELVDLADRKGIDGDRLVRISRLTAKVDNTAVLDGYALYLHGFVVTDDGDWVVVQQGMNGEDRQARRYHWHAPSVTSFVNEPHNAVIGEPCGEIINLTDHRATDARRASVDLLDSGPGAVVDEFLAISGGRHLAMPAHHDVRVSDVFVRRLHGVLALARESGTADFQDLLLTRGLGPRTMQALALVAEVTCGAPSRFDDPARFSFAHGGKDGHPHPVPLRIYDQTIATLRRSLQDARIGQSEKIRAFARLDERARALETASKTDDPDLEAIIESEWRHSKERGGMTVMGPVSPAVEKKVRGPAPSTKPKQLKLFG